MSAQEDIDRMRADLERTRKASPPSLQAAMEKLETTAHEVAAERQALRRALKPFVKAYAKAADPIGDSDLYDEQPRSVSVTLGDCRRAAALLGIYPKVRP